MSDRVDFAIVGGGASGVYAAWRLAHASDEELRKVRQRIGGEGPLRIVVYERSGRIGGRLLSASPATMADTAMELGGMRYLNTQPLVKGLVENKLRVATHEQHVDDPSNFAHLRGRVFRQGDLDNPMSVLPYRLTEAERLVVTAAGAGSPAQLLFWAVFQEFPQIKRMVERKDMQAAELEEFLQHAEVDGRPLFQVGFWNLLSRHLSNEGRELAITTIGYDVLGANANAVDIIAENFDFQSDTRYYLFDEGFESVIWALADQFEARGGTIRCEMDLESFDDADDGGLTLEFSGGDAVATRAVVLAMPQAAIQSLRRRGPLLDRTRAPHVPLMLNSVEGIPLYKLFVVYDTPWWQERWGLERGRTLTDTPVRQCYYWSTNEGAPSALMAYNDLASTSFWGGYQTGPLGPWDTQQVDGAPEGPLLFDPDATDADTPQAADVRRRRRNWDMHRAPHELVMEMHRQLMEIHAVDDAPEPVDAAFMDWMNEPYGGAVHFWNPGYKSWELRDQMTQPVEGLNAFIIGESYSTAQTWVEGAFQTAEIFLQKRLGMEHPSWVEDEPKKQRHRI